MNSQNENDQNSSNKQVDNSSERDADSSINSITDNVSILIHLLNFLI